jgi:type II secretory pathway component PulF
MLAASRAYRAHVWLISAGLLGALVLAFRWAKSYEGRMLLLRLLTRLPKVRPLVLKVTGVRFLQQASRLVQAGKPTAEAVRVAAAGIEHPELRPAYDTLAERLRLGAVLSEVLYDSQLFQPVVITYVRAGEEGGGLADMLQAAASQEEAEVQEELDRLLEILPNVLMVFTGVVVAVLLVAQWSGIFAIQTMGVH